MDLINLVILIFCFLLLLAFYYRLINKDLPPGPYGLPLIGYNIFLGKDPIATMTNLKKTYGNVVSLRLGPKLVVILNDWQAVHMALIKHGDNFSGRPKLSLSEVAFSEDIILSDGSNWKKARHFSLTTLKALGINQSSMETVIMEEVYRLSDMLDTKDGQIVDISSLFFVPILNMIWGISAGRSFEHNDQIIAKFQEMSYALKSGATYKILNYWPILRFFLPKQEKIFGRFQSATEKIRSFLEDEVNNHIKNFNENNINDFIDFYLLEINKQSENNDGVQREPFDKKHLISILLDLFVAGVDTVETTMCWAILHMALHPDIQRKVQDELDKVVARDSFFPVSSKKLAPYTEATLLEIQRTPTVAPLSVPHRSLNNTTLLGFKIPKDTIVYPNLHAVHHDKEYWGDPENFRPERFLDETGTNILKKDAFIPFSVGQRECLGKSLARTELHLLFTNLMRRFTFETITGQPKSSMELIPGTTYSMKPFSLVIRSRKALQGNHQDL